MPQNPDFNAPAAHTTRLVCGSVPLKPCGGSLFPIISRADDSSASPVLEQRAFFIRRASCVRPSLGAPGPVVSDQFVSRRLVLPLIEVEEVHA